MGNALSYAWSVAQLKFILMILLKRLYLESQKTLATLFMPKKIERGVFLIKKTSQNSCWVKKSKTDVNGKTLKVH